MASLIDIVRNRFLEIIRSVNPPGRWKIIVIDEHAQKLLGAVLKTYDVLEENVTLIEAIASHRQPQPGLEALYLLMPTNQNVERIIADFSNGRVQYGGAHLFFMDALPEELFNKLTTSPAEPHLKGLVDLFVNFRAVEAQAFSIHAPHHFFSFFSPPQSHAVIQQARARVEEDLKYTAKSILNVLISVNENPLIRYYLPDHPPLGPLASQAVVAKPVVPEAGSGRWRGALQTSNRDSRADNGELGDHLTKRLAFMVQHELDEHCKNNPDFVRNSSSTSRPKAVLLITDRTMDMSAPFLHEFTYQAMANDLLPIEGGTKYRYKFQSSLGAFEDKTAMLVETDEIWTQNRHMHMRETIDKLMADFNNFLEEHAGFKGGEGAASINDMKDMLASLPQYQEMREKFSLHLNMAQECMALFEKKKLTDTASVEQQCATASTTEGKTPKNLVEEMVPLLDDPAVSNRDKVRIIALYAMFRQGVPDEDKRRLFQHARLTLAEQDAVNALVHFGIRVTRQPGDKDVKKFKQKPHDSDYDLSRYHPVIEQVLEDHLTNKLDQAQFPYVRNAPPANPTASVARTAAAAPATSLRSSKPAWHRATRPGAAKDELKQRLLVYVAGGMTYSEIRTVYQLSQSHNKDIFIGSSHIITPEAFIDDLKVLEAGGVGSKAIPKGLQNVEVRGEPRPYQVFYDQRYFTKDPPPPPRPATAPIQNSPHPPGSNRSTRTAPGGASGLAPPRGVSPATSATSLRDSRDSGGDGEKKKKHLFGKFRF